MTDYLLVHGAAQGAWSWGKVWGHMTAPREHPPRLYLPRQALRVRAIDLPGHGADRAADVAVVDMQESSRALAQVVAQENFTDYVLVGHELGGTVAIQAIGDLPVKPKRIVLVSGIVPANGEAPLSAYPLPTRVAVCLSALIGGLSGRDVGVPSGAIEKYRCAGLDAMQRIETVGQIGPLPLRMLTQSVSLPLADLPCPVTYVVLTDNRLISPARQRTMAARVPDAAILELDAGHQAAIQQPRALAELLLAV